MKKQPLIYKEQVVGYLDVIEMGDDGKIDQAIIYLFFCKLFDEIREHIERGTFISFDNNPDIKNINNNTLYNFDIKNDMVIVKRIIENPNE
jgi:hypothetical protein